MEEFHFGISDLEQADEMHKLVLKYLKIQEHDYVLDVGCGMGTFFEKIRVPIERYGLDINPRFIGICNQKYQGHFWECDVCQGLPFEDEMFDVVIAICVLEHVNNPTLLIREAYRVCKKGGKAIFVTPNLARLFRLFKAIHKEEKGDRSGHKQGWDWHLLTAVLEFNGWTIERFITRFVDCPFYDYLPRFLSKFISHKILLKIFPYIGSELYAFCTKD